MSNKSKNILFTSMFFVGILLLFILFEIVLRIFSYGYSTDLFRKPPHQNKYYTDNLFVINKYNPGSKIINDEGQTYRNLFTVNKSDDTLRVFVLGGSTAYGFPYHPNISFSKIMELSLKESQHFKKTEVINLGVSAMSSYYVKDVAKKILKYDPDVLVIYAGHNEYYGTISYSTGGSRFIKNLNMALKEIKIFQLLFNMLEPKEDKKPDETLMSKQFNNNKIPKKESVDQKVAKDFINNIDRVVTKYSRKGINVIIVEPACNLIDMPPFDSEDSQKMGSAVSNYQQIIALGDTNLIADYLKKYQNSGNAHINYLNGQAKLKLNRSDYLEDFIKAKDLDTIPFRARSALLDALKDYSMKSKDKYPNLTYIDLNDILIDNFSLKSMGNSLFIDHLHFNWTGQKLLSQIIVQAVVRIYKFDSMEKKRMNAFYENSETIKEKTHHVQLFELMLVGSMSQLFNQPPYSNMLLKYYPSFPEVKLKSEPVMSYLRGKDSTYLFDTMIKYYSANSNFQELISYHKAIGNISPGGYDSKLDLANLLIDIWISNTNIISLLSDAYLLSGKKRAVLNSVETYYIKNNDKNGIQMFVDQYGKPSN